MWFTIHFIYHLTPPPLSVSSLGQGLRCALFCSFPSTTRKHSMQQVLSEDFWGTCMNLFSWTALTFQRRPGISEHEVSLSHAAPSPRPEGKKNDRSGTESTGQAGSQRTRRLDQPCRCISSLPPLPPRLLTSSCSPSHLHSPGRSSTEARIHKPDSFSPTQWTSVPPHLQPMSTSSWENPAGAITVSCKALGKA